MNQLNGIVALVTGASSGLGASVAQVFAERGATVFGIARDANRLAEVFAEVPGGRYASVDITGADACRRAVAQCVSEFGRLDALAIDDDNRGRRRAAFFLAYSHRQDRQNLIQKAAIPPAVEPVLNGRKWRKILWKQTPLTTGSNLVEDCVQNCPKRMSATAAFFRTRK